MINVASTCLACMPTTLLFPVMVWVATVFIYAYFVIVLWYLASAGSWDAAQHRYIWNEDLQRLMVLTFSKETYYCWSISKETYYTGASYGPHILKSQLYSDLA